MMITRMAPCVRLQAVAMLLAQMLLHMPALQAWNQGCLPLQSCMQASSDAKQSSLPVSAPGLTADSTQMVKTMFAEGKQATHALLV